MDTAAAMERYRQSFFAQYPPICVDNLRAGMKIVVPDDPNDYGGGNLFMEVTGLKLLSNAQMSIVGRLTQAHPEIGNVGNDVVALSPFEDVGQL